MKKLILIGIGLAAAAAFIGFDAVDAFVDHARESVRSKLMSPEVELQGQIEKAHELSQRCAESVVHGRVSLDRLDRMIEQRQEELSRRQGALSRDREVLEHRRALLAQNRHVYFIANERVSQRTLNEDALLRARAYTTDRGITDQLAKTIDELKAQRAHTAREIDAASVEQRRLAGQVEALSAELENLQARKAVAQTREEAGYAFDRSTFDKAYDKISEIRARIAEQNKMLDYYSRTGSGSKGLIPAGVDVPQRSGLDAIDTALAKPAPSKDGAQATVRAPAAQTLQNDN